MKKNRLNILIASITLLLAWYCPLHAGIPVFSDNNYNENYFLFSDSSTYAAQLNNEVNTGKSNEAATADLNMHKILGWSTIASAAATFAAIGLGNEDVHCGLAYTSTVLAAATCSTGYYSYSDVLGNDTQYTVHAVLGTLATAGFGAALALADGGAHAAAGTASGVVFIITVGVLYF